jgi:protein O-GlcNAc transferase
MHDTATKVRQLLVEEQYSTALTTIEADGSTYWTSSIEGMYLRAMCFTHLGRAEEACVYAQIVGMHPAETNPAVVLDCLSILAKGLALADARSLLMGRSQLFVSSELDLDQLQRLSAISNALELQQIGHEILESKREVFEVSADYHLICASLARSMGNLDTEKEALISALEIAPKDSRVHANIANLFDRFSEHGIAAEHNKIAELENQDGIHPNIAMDFFLSSISKGLYEQDRLKDKWLTQIEGDRAFYAPFGILTATDNPELIFKENNNFSEVSHINHMKNPLRLSANRRRAAANNKIRIGYFSPDFRNHAVTHLINDLLLNHDRSKFEIFGFSIDHYDDSIYRKKIIDGCDDFFSFENTSTETVASQANKLNLDFAIDLAGYTKGYRPQLFERLKQSRIINFLGYPSTIGANFYDYIIGDKIVTPEGCDQFFSEKIIRLGRCYQCNSPSRQIDPIDRSATGLPADSFVFCNFNARQKMNLETLLAWKRILSECQDSVLWLLEPGDIVKSDMKSIFGDAFNRVVFAQKVSVEQHLARITFADVFLDSFPYGAHTTASDAIYNGIPIISRSGRYFQSRVSWSLMHHSGVSDLNAFTWDEFVEKAIDFYQNFSADKMKIIRNQLLDRANETHPYNIESYAKEFEKILQNALAE